MLRIFYIHSPDESSGAEDETEDLLVGCIEVQQLDQRTHFRAILNKTPSLCQKLLLFLFKISRLSFNLIWQTKKSIMLIYAIILI